MNENKNEWAAWLIEKDGPRYRTMEQGNVVWTNDPLEALHFCRRIDAERFAEEDDEAWTITEHLFCGQ